MEQKFDVDVHFSDSPSGLPQNVQEDGIHLLGASLSPVPRPPSTAKDELKRKVPRPPQVLPRLLRKAPVGLTARLKESAGYGTDDEDAEAADLGYGPGPTAKRSSSSLQAPQTLSPEQQGLIMRCKIKPPREYDSDWEVLVPLSPPCRPSGTATPSPSTPAGAALASRGHEPFHTSTSYAVVRSSCSWRISDGWPMATAEALPRPPSEQQPHLLRQSSPMQRQQSLAHHQTQQSPQPPQQTHRQTQGSPRLARQATALGHPATALSSADLDRAGEALPGFRRANAVSFDGRGTVGRSVTPTGRSVAASQSHRDSHGWIGAPQGLCSAGTASAAAAGSAAGTGGGQGGGHSPFGANSGLVAAAAAATASTTTAAPIPGGGGDRVSATTSAPAAVPGSPASYVLGRGASIGGGSGSSNGNSVRSSLASPLSVPTLPSASKPTALRSTLLHSGSFSSAVAPCSPRGTLASAPLPSAAPSSRQHSPSLASPAAPGSPLAAPPTTPPSGTAPQPYRPHSLALHPPQLAAGGSPTALSSHADLSGNGVSGGAGKGTARRFPLPAAGNGKGLAGNAEGGDGLSSAAVLAAAQMIERSCGGPLPRITALAAFGQSVSLSGHPHHQQQKRPATSMWPLSPAAGGVGRGGGGGIGRGMDDELTVVRRSCSAIAAVSASPLVREYDGEHGDAAGGSGSDTASEGEGDGPGRRALGHMGALLHEYTEEGPLSREARQLVALHQAAAKSRARRSLSKDHDQAEHGVRRRPALSGRA